MIVTIQPVDGAVALTDPDVFTTFHVKVPSGSDLAVAATHLGTEPTDVEDHLWVPVGLVREMAGGSDEWNLEFDAMLGYAASKGWLSEDGSQILAHVEYD